jgi:hypothetical protein
MHMYIQGACHAGKSINLVFLSFVLITKKINIVLSGRCKIFLDASRIGICTGTLIVKDLFRLLLYADFFKLATIVDRDEG